jgi:hypothetical protein
LRGSILCSGVLREKVKFRRYRHTVNFVPMNEISQSTRTGT